MPATVVFIHVRGISSFRCSPPTRKQRASAARHNYLVRCSIIGCRCFDDLSQRECLLSSMPFRGLKETSSHFGSGRVDFLTPFPTPMQFSIVIVSFSSSFLSLFLIVVLFMNFSVDHRQHTCRVYAISYPIKLTRGFVPATCALWMKVNSRRLFPP